MLNYMYTINMDLLTMIQKSYQFTKYVQTNLMHSFMNIHNQKKPPQEIYLPQNLRY